ncbi:hypothetical protein F4560_000052 [Saccharothrix ecbatanensis]|uniref:Uncharacterized protein n=1 Tax=Saccharothrix ecbatanensis TaxID=1105145 RepID=A0A7W9HDI4_9PSEU|nr:hypothetical protein [Saccharothrix ecbatanensis]
MGLLPVLVTLQQGGRRLVWTVLDFADAAARPDRP